jgi:nucleotide-binding universal stress UspA family protein
MDTGQSSRRTVTEDAAKSAMPLSPIEARRTEEEARQESAAADSGYFELHAHSKVEAETRRLSEEVTREARERLRASQAHPPASALSEMESGQSPGRESSETLDWHLPAPTNFERILVPCDGTAFAERALPYVAAIARLTAAPITLVYVDPTPARLDLALGGQMSSRVHTYELEMREYLGSLRHRLLADLHPVRLAVKRAPSPAQGLLEMEGPADLVVMTTHARRGAQRLLLGSVADDLLRHGSAPILLVPPHVVDPAPHEPVLARALVPLDGSLLAEQAVGMLGGLLAKGVETNHALGEIILLTIVKQLPGVEEGERYLDGVRRQLEVQYAAQQTAIRTVTTIGDPSEVIASVAPSSGPADATFTADILILATHGRGGLGRWLLGSVADAVLAHTTLPLLLLHPLSTEP